MNGTFKGLTGMDLLIRLEEAGLFALSLYLYSFFSYPWWLFPLLLFLPDVSILAYMAGDLTGAYVYNFLHHRGIALLLYGSGSLWHNPPLALAGLVLFAHSSLDRALGYGLKHPSGFGETHLGRIGRDDGEAGS